MIFMLGTGPATSKIIQSVEFLRRRMKGVHVAYEILSTHFKDVYEPLVEGLDEVTLERRVPTLKAHITITEGDKLKDLSGYMPPLDENLLLNQEQFEKDIQRHFDRQGERPQNRDGGRYRGNRGGHRGNRGKRGGHRNNYRGNKPYNKNQGNKNRNYKGKQYGEKRGGPQRKESKPQE